MFTFTLNILNFVISGLTIWMSIPYLAIKVWMFTSAVVSIVVRNTIFRKAPPSVVFGEEKQSINLNKVVATFEKHIFLSQTDLTRTGIISNSYTLCRTITWVVFLRMFWNLSAAYQWREEDPFHFGRFSLLPFQSYWLLDMTENRIFTLCHMITWVVFLRMFWHFISSLPVTRGGSLSFLTIFIFCRSRVIGLDMTENRIFTLCCMITWVVFLRMF